jgi:hypothetical protein
MGEGLSHSPHEKYPLPKVVFEARSSIVILETFLIRLYIQCILTLRRMYKLQGE